jgi:Cytochrome oxidase complex assembly protein 1
MSAMPPLPPGSIPPPYSPVQKSGWFSRNWKWFIPTLFIVIFVLPLSLCGGLVYVVMASLKNSDVARESLARAQANPALIEKLGTPIQMGAWVGGSVNSTPADGNAELVMPLMGPKGSGVLAVTARKTAGEWHYLVMTVTIQGGGNVNLLKEAEQRQRDCPQPPASSESGPSSN